MVISSNWINGNERLFFFIGDIYRRIGPDLSWFMNTRPPIVINDQVLCGVTIATFLSPFITASLFIGIAFQFDRAVAATSTSFNGASHANAVELHSTRKRVALMIDLITLDYSSTSARPLNAGWSSNLAIGNFCLFNDLLTPPPPPPPLFPMSTSIVNLIK